MKRILLALLALLTVASPVLAISPVVRGMKPVGGRRGTEVVVTLTGQRLADTRGILFYEPGIVATKIEAGKDDQVKATFKISPDAPPGLYDFRLRTATGISPLRTFSVGVLEEVAEVEPNNDFAKPQPINMNVTVNGVAANEDVDYYAVKAKKGERITVEIEGIRLGLTLFDPYVAILNSKRFELASNDDSALVWQDGLVSRRRPRGRHLHHRGPRGRLRGERQLPLSPACRQLPAADGDGSGGRQSRRDDRRALDRRRARRNDHQPDPAGKPRSPLRPARPRRSGHGPIPQRLPAQPVRQHDRARAQRLAGDRQSRSLRPWP